MQQNWKPGDLVVVVTVNRGLPVRPPRKGRKPDAVESWAGAIVGPSLVGPGWWNVRRISPKGRGIGSVDFEAATLSSQVPAIVGSAARANSELRCAATDDLKRDALR